MPGALQLRLATAARRAALPRTVACVAPFRGDVSAAGRRLGKLPSTCERYRITGNWGKMCQKSGRRATTRHRLALDKPRKCSQAFTGARFPLFGVGCAARFVRRNGRDREAKRRENLKNCGRLLRCHHVVMCVMSRRIRGVRTTRSAQKSRPARRALSEVELRVEVGVVSGAATSDGRVAGCREFGGVRPNRSEPRWQKREDPLADASCYAASMGPMPRGDGGADDAAVRVRRAGLRRTRRMRAWGVRSESPESTGRRSAYRPDRRVCRPCRWRAGSRSRDGP